MKDPGTGSVVLHDTVSGEWLSFNTPVRVYKADRLEEVLPVLETLQDQVDHHRLYAAGFISYDAAPAFDASLKTKRLGQFPLVWFGLYESPESIALPKPSAQKTNPAWNPSVTEKEYRNHIKTVKEEIRRGNTYQVNYTYRLHTRTVEDPWTFFLQIQAAQDAAYGAYIHTEDWTVCSASPELFFTLKGDKITSRPMKGTASRAPGADEDLLRAQWLKNSKKNRAENLMIVDMIRNDLGRIARPGSVGVPELFTLERYPTLWQMTSLVEAETDAPISELFRALFPCASITGAPKCKTMEIINEVETTARGLYTGTIGYLAPDRRAQFNVAIRTGVINNETGQTEYGTGGGITWDSMSEEEYAETLTKARILTEKAPPFYLLETLLWEENRGYFLLERHIKRMKASADYFGYPFNETALLNLLARKEELFSFAPRRIRLLLNKEGAFSWEDSEVNTEAESLWKLELAKEPVSTTETFLYHKTTHRQVYNRLKSLSPYADDVLLWNQRGELTESCIGNLVIRINGKEYTPPVKSGLLAGTYRDSLLEAGKLEEHVLYKRDLEQAEEIYLINSVRKKQPVLFSL